MNWLTNIFKKESAVGHLISAHVLGRAVFPKRNFQTFAKEAYQLNIIAYRCIELISTAAASVPWLLYDDATDKEIDKHELLTLLKRPNPSQSGKEMFTSTYAYDLLTGNSYMERVIVGGARVQELWAHRPDRMKILPGRFGLPGAFEYTVGGTTPKKFEADPMTGDSDILHVKRFNPLDDWYGQSPLEAIGMSVDSHNEATKWNFALLQNGARPSGALQAEGPLDADEYQRLKKELTEGYSKGSQGKPMVLQGGLTWVQMMLSSVEMDWLAGKERSAAEIAIGYKVPEQLVGVKGQQTYNNYREARMALYEDAVLPLLDRYAECLTYWFKRIKGFENLCLKYDEDRIPALYPRREAMWEKINAAKFITIDEKREALGYEPYDPEDNKPGNMIFVAASEIPLEMTGLDGGTTPPGTDANGDPIVGSGTSLTGGGGAPVQDLALNGAQISAVVQIVQAVADGNLPPESAVQLLLVSFPSIDEATAHLMVDPAESFEPTPDPALMMPAVPAGPGQPKPVPAQKPKTPVQKRVMFALGKLIAKDVAAYHRKAYRLAYGGSDPEDRSVHVNVSAPDVHVAAPEVNVDARTTVAKDAVNTDNVHTTEIKEPAPEKKELPSKIETKYTRDPDTMEITGKVDVITYKEQQQ